MKFIFGKAMLLASALLFSITGIGCSSDDSPASEKEKPQSAWLCYATWVLTPYAFVCGLIPMVDGVAKMMLSRRLVERSSWVFA